MSVEWRKLEFSSYADVIREIESLEKSGYEKAGGWSLGQVLFHLDFYHKGSLDGFEQMLPWVVRFFIGKPLFWWMMGAKELKKGMTTAPQSAPSESVDEKTVLEQAKENLRRLETARKLYPSALFGELSVEDWKKLHLAHAGHHLGFLVPA